jgi:hypothetical protein
MITFDADIAEVPTVKYLESADRSWLIPVLVEYFCN